jgi:DNA-directed RNA polymerase specialized sigma subunit
MRKNPNQIVSQALRSARLTDIQAYVLGRYMDGLLQREIAAELHCSRPYITRVIRASIIKLRSVVPRYEQALGSDGESPHKETL